MTPDLCVHCGAVLDAAGSPFNPRAKPAPGALFVCMYCGVITVFDEAMKRRLLDKHELRELPKQVRRKLVAIESARQRIMRDYRGGQPKMKA